MNDKIHKTGFSVPRGLRVYAIGDVHGHLKALNRMHDAIAADLIEHAPETVHIVYMGDYIDRGPESAGVIECLIGRMARKDGIEKTFLQGNHEAGLMAFLKAPEGSLAMDWMRYGGVQTLASYGVRLEGDIPIASEYAPLSARLAQIMPPAHHCFLGSLAGAIEIGGYFFAHAGVDPTKPLAAQELADLMFMREPFLSWNKPLAKMVVHGHTIAKEPVLAPHRIGIDTGVYQSGGRLTAGVFEDACVRFLQVEAA